MSIAKKPTVPQFSSRVTPEKGVHPTRLPEETRILRGAMGLHNNEVSGIIEPIVEKMSGDNEKKFKGLFRRLKDSPDYKRSETVVRLLLQLLGGNGRLNKRLRKKRDEEARLLFAGLVHPIHPEHLRAIGLPEIADIMDCGQLRTPSQCLLYGAIEYVKARDREPALVLLQMIQEKDWGTKRQMLLSCLVLDILGLKDESLSHEEIRAKNIAQTYIFESASIPK